LSKPVAFDELTIRSENYSLRYADSGGTVNKVPVFVKYYDPKTLILKFDLLDFEKEYTLRFEKLRDYSGRDAGAAAAGANTIIVTMGKR